LVLLLGAQHVAAVPPDPRYRTGVFLKNLGDHLYEGQLSAAGSLTNTTNGSTLTTEGLASFGDSDASVSSDSPSPAPSPRDGRAPTYPTR